MRDVEGVILLEFGVSANVSISILKRHGDASPAVGIAQMSEG